MEDGEEGATVNSTSNINGIIFKPRIIKDELRTFRMDKDEANKNQVSLLRYFRSRGKTSIGKEMESSTDSDNNAEDATSPVLKSSIPSTKLSDGTISDSPLTPKAHLSGDTSLGSLRNFKKLTKESDGKVANRTLVTASTSIPRNKMFTKPFDSSLSKPVFVDAPSPDSKDEDEDSNEESSNYDDDDESSHNPLGGISMKTLINKTSTSKVSVNDSDVEQDSQDSQIIRPKVVKRVRIVASSDEDEDLPPPAKKQQLNGHNSASEDSSSMPDDDIIEKFTDMWEKVYPFVDKMDVLDIYRQNDWDAKLTMAQLDKTNRQNKNKHKLKKMDEEASKKRKLAEQQEGKKQHKMAEKELESMARTLMKEKLKARKQAWKGKAVARNDDQDLDEDEDDYHFGGSKVYDSEDEDQYALIRALRPISPSKANHYSDLI